MYTLSGLRTRFVYCSGSRTMKLIHDSASCLLHLLLFAELFVHSSTRPAQNVSLCGMFGSMVCHVNRLMNLSNKLYVLTDEERAIFEGVENTLDGLPHIQHTADYFTSIKVNESLSHLYVHTRAFRLHVDWLKTAKRDFSLCSQSDEDAGTHLLQLSNLINASLHQVSNQVPESPPPSLPVVSTAFDVLQVSVEISQRLRVFCDWSKRVIRILHKLSRCPKLRLQHISNC